MIVMTILSMLSSSVYGKLTVFFGVLDSTDRLSGTVLLQEIENICACITHFAVNY